MRKSLVVVLGAVSVLAAGCANGSPGAAPSASAPSSVSPSVSPPVTPSVSPTTTRSPRPTPTRPRTATPSPSPSPTRPPTPTASPPSPGRVLTAAGAYLQASEDENLTEPDPENGCEVHDPDLTQVTCGVVNMAGGVATWVSGYERHNLPGAHEPRRTIRVYQRLASGTDSLAWVGFGEPGQWADAEARVGSLTGQTRDSLVVVVTFRGSGTLAGYDVLTWRAGTPYLRLRAHHEEGSHAHIFVRSRGYVSTYVADYSDGAPNCCPNSWQHDNVYWDGTNFRIRYFPNVSSPPS